MATVVQRGRLIQDPPLVRSLFSEPKAAYLWLAVRLWLGYQWIDAALHKVTNPAWTQTGDALKGFWTGSVQIPRRRPPADLI